WLGCWVSINSFANSPLTGDDGCGSGRERCVARHFAGCFGSIVRPARMDHTHPRMRQARPVLLRLAIRLMLEGAWPGLTASAAPSDVALRDYIHTIWTHHDGAPLGTIKRILQTSDGYLWIFTSDDLLRFDGMRFVRAATPCTAPVSSVTGA